MGEMLVGELKYDLSKDHILPAPRSCAATNTTRLEYCNNNIQQNHGENRPIPQSNTNGFAITSVHNPIQVNSATKFKDDIFSHNQFNYHHSNIITQKLPNIEYFNYVESANFLPNRMGLSQNGLNVCMNGIINDLSRDCPILRNGERTGSKIPTKISNFNF